VRRDRNGRRPDVFVRDTIRGTTELVSVSSGERQGNAESGRPSVSADGRYVAFSSRASNLVRGDRNRADDCFVRDLRRRTTVRVSVGSDGVEATEPPWWDWDNDFNGGCRISGRGRHVLFDSPASNLVRGDSNAVAAPSPEGTPEYGPDTGRDAFVHNLRRRTTRRVSLAPSGDQLDGSSYGAAISANGRFVAFNAETPTLIPSANEVGQHIGAFVRDVRRGSLHRVDLSNTGATANRYTAGLSLSADGRLVALQSYATNFLPGDRNDAADIFVRGPLR
jgi:hypothetical protein